MFATFEERTKSELRAAQASARREREQYRDALLSQIKSNSVVRSKSRESGISEGRRLSGLNIGEYKRKPRDELTCSQYNLRSAEKKQKSPIAAKPSPNTTGKAAAPPSASELNRREQYRQIIQRRQELQHGVQRYCKEETKWREQSRLETKHRRLDEQEQVAQRANAIRREMEAERQKAREKQAEIRQILLWQMGDRRRERAENRLEERKYRAWNEAAATITPEKVDRRCRACKSPLK